LKRQKKGKFRWGRGVTNERKGVGKFIIILKDGSSSPSIEFLFYGFISFVV